jgi:hypothetical protein
MQMKASEVAVLDVNVDTAIAKNSSTSTFIPRLTLLFMRVLSASFFTKL